MLILQSNISFDKQDNSSEKFHGLSNDLSAKYILRPDINFGGNMLFSGTIIVDKNIDIIKREEIYNVMIEMPTIEQEAYEAISSLLRIGGDFKIQWGSRVIGKGKILDFLYE